MTRENVSKVERHACHLAEILSDILSDAESLLELKARAGRLPKSPLKTSIMDLIAKYFDTPICEGTSYGECREGKVIAFTDIHPSDVTAGSSSYDELPVTEVSPQSSPPLPDLNSLSDEEVIF